MHRFFVPANSISGDEVALSKEQAHQIRSVLRLRPGHSIVVLDNTGGEYEVTLTSVEPTIATGIIRARGQAPGEPSVQITLFQAMLAREKFELVLQKCTEVGVARFVPVITERTIVRNTAIKENKLIRWRQIITEAAEQSRRGKIPRLETPMALADALKAAGQSDLRLVAFESEKDAPLHRILRDPPRKLGTVALLIGPEGGFSQQEIELAHRQDWRPFGLGPRILRTETAAIVVTSAILYEFEQMI